MRNIILKLTIFIFILSFPFSAFSKNHIVEMLNFKDGESMVFSPHLLKINPGDSATFIPTDKGHNTQSVFIPKQAKPWKSKNNKKITVNFEQEGVYIYECKNHAVMSMVGVIQVGKASNIDQAKSFVKTYKKKFAMKKDRLDQYLELI